MPGLEKLHVMTSRLTYDLRVEVTSFNGTTHYATFSNFSIDDNSNYYTLHFDSFTGGDAGRGSVF